VYDAAYRLTNQQKSGQAATFVYDNAGNITVKHHEGSNPLTMSFDAGNRITTSVLGSSQFTTFTHDANGNMTGERCDYLGVLTTYQYDSENRCLNELRGSGAHHTYTYAPDGLRRSAHHGGAANPVSFVWDGDDLLNEYRLGGVSCRYDVLEGEVLGEKRDASRYLYLPDPLGSINHLLDTSQTIAGTYVYFPYGEVQSHTGPDTPLQFVGGLGYYTGVVNREYVRARWYRPDLGRWQTRDPIGFGGGDWNLYGYVRGRAITAADRNGLGYHPCALDPCAFARASGALIPREWSDQRPGTVGCVVCCMGRAVPCLAYRSPAISPVRQVVEECIRRHEEDHAIEATRRDVCACNDWTGCVGGYAVDECRAYVVEVLCLLRNAPYACAFGDASCAEELLFWQAVACLGAIKHCSTVGMHVPSDCVDIIAAAQRQWGGGGWRVL